MIEVLPLAIPDVKLIRPARFYDERGLFSETYNRKRFGEAGITVDFVQDNHSVSRHRGTVRGLHFQRAPFAQAKLVRVVRGAAFDVAVDLRPGSPSFGRHVSVVLSAELWNQIFIPEGFAHGFCTLEPDTELVYKVSRYRVPEQEAGIRWNDPDLGIEWPVEPAAAVLSARDQALPSFADECLRRPAGAVAGAAS
ncbi:MAG TPA: dTDP-4-dehydrorhamnose 3,5-epimerase [Alphaproteobacteria bacterium]